MVIAAIRNAFPLFDDNGLSEVEHHCEWGILQERKRLHALLDSLEGRNLDQEGSGSAGHESAQTMAHDGSAAGVSGQPIAFGYRFADGTFDVTADPEVAGSWARYAPEECFGLYLHSQLAEARAAVDELIEAADYVARYVASFSAMTYSPEACKEANDRLTAALARVGGGK